MCRSVLNQLNPPPAVIPLNPLHIPLLQEVVKRVVIELQVRGYRTWFGAHDAFSL